MFIRLLAGVNPCSAAPGAEGLDLPGERATTLPRERTRAVLLTREFLQALADSELDLPQSVRRRAITLLRHYPHARDLELAHLEVPG